MLKITLAQGINSAVMGTTTFAYYADPRLDPGTTKFLIILAALTATVAIVIYIFSSKTFYRFIIVALLLVSAASLVTVIYRNIVLVNSTPIFSPKDMANSLWIQYKTNYFEQDTFRVLDRERDDVTTSEGQSYAMLRAVWMGDKEAFDGAWKWTKTNLQRNDSLFSWLYGQNPNGKYGILREQDGQNTASDADTDIALSLLFAYSRWREPTYYSEAKKIISSIWQNEVIMIGGKPYLAANDVERNSATNILMNPSYLAPYAYRIFAIVDPIHDWNTLIDTSYDVISQSIKDPLDKNLSAYIPPDWILINRRTGAISATENPKLSTDYSYDALRLPWRLGLDLAWYGDNRAETILRQFKFLDTDWQTNNIIHSHYSHDGKVVELGESPAMYAGSLIAIQKINPEHATEIYRQKLTSLFNPDSESWKVPLGYYNENWVWFGIALYNNLLPNLTDSNTSRIIK